MPVFCKSDSKLSFAFSFSVSSSYLLMQSMQAPGVLLALSEYEQL